MKNFRIIALFSLVLASSCVGPRRSKAEYPYAHQDRAYELSEYGKANARARLDEALARN